jgi:riboflavin kinase / FMN adenylyltransferase
MGAGARLAFPQPFACPGHGVYACLANGHAAAVSIGVRPTFQTGRGELIEAYLLDFEGDLYGANLYLEFVQRLRGERRFDDASALVAQMQRDVERTRELVAPQRA